MGVPWSISPWVSRANDVNFEASAFELERPESQRRCQQGGPQLKHGHKSRNHHLNHNQCQVGAELLTSLHGTIGIIWPEHLGGSCYRQAWWPELSPPSQRSGTAEEQKVHIEKGMSFSNYLYEPMNFFHCLPAEPKYFSLQSFYWTQIN